MVSVLLAMAAASNLALRQHVVFHGMLVHMAAVRENVCSFVKEVIVDVTLHQNCSFQYNPGFCCGAKI